MFGSPTPTKQLCAPPSSRALAAIIISDFEYPRSVARIAHAYRP